jgi:hypothetical protein
MIELYGTPWLVNSSYYQQLTQLNTPPYRSPKIDNGAVLFADVKPVTNYERMFLKSFKSVHSGHNSFIPTTGSSLSHEKQFITSNGRHHLHLPGSATLYKPAIRLNNPLYGPLPTINDWPTLRIDIAAKAKSTGFDAGTFLAERRKTTEYLQKAIPTFMRSAHSLVRNVARAQKAHRPGKHLSRAIDNVGNEWLAARYGLRPILYDIENAVKAYEIGLQKLIRCVISEEKPASITNLGSFSIPKALLQANKSISVNAGSIYGNTQGVREDVKMCRASAGITSLLQSWMTLNPTLTAIELVPFSFVLGWVSNIPDMLVAHAPVFDRVVNYYCLGMKTSRKTVYTATWLGKTQGNCYISGNSGWSEKFTHDVNQTQITTIECDIYKRERIEPTDIPWVHSTAWNLSSAQLLDLAALAKGLGNRTLRI